MPIRIGSEADLYGCGMVRFPGRGLSPSGVLPIGPTMLFEASALSDFYASDEGAIVRWCIARRVMQLWPSVGGARILGFGFAPPYLESWTAAERMVAYMPEKMGALAWPRYGPSATVLGEEAVLPFADAFFDRIVVVHGLETAKCARAVLRQLWRVLTPEGRIVVVVPNRLGLWAHAESSPFALGRPFYRYEIVSLLCETLFEPVRWQRALCLPASARRLSKRNRLRWEAVGCQLWPVLAGVHIVEAQKTLYGVTPLCKAVERKTIFVEA